ncbi:molybdenum cofactor biosynthesis protein [Methanobacterium ferruginis]|nr:molybdenum cofactor biosynthesis protein [Methanobacterium ferruginis]
MTMSSESMKEHKKQSPSRVKVGIITLSDSKSQLKEEDLSGKIIKESLEEQHEIVSYQIIPDEGELLLKTLEMMKDKKAEVVFSTGGTGIGKRDITIETIKPLFEKELNGFGEIFRYESYKELGTGAILSRATAGVWQNTFLVALPGSPHAVELGMKIIKPELGHLVKHMKH